MMAALGPVARRPARVYLTGGATAVLHGWRVSTIDVDLKLVPDDDGVLHAIPKLKERLSMNIEPMLYRYPAVDPPAFRRAVEAATGGAR
jgi:hypothetical protein